MTKMMIPAAILSAALTACGSPSTDNEAAPADNALIDPGLIEPPSEGIDLVASDGSVIGKVQVSEDEGGLSLKIDANGDGAGTHGVHLHETGRCETPDFASAGGHWNPTGKAHGRDNPSGQHLGDLPNLLADDMGRIDSQFRLDGVTKAQLADADGTALMIHADPDDYRTDPSGNSGARIICAVLAAPESAEGA